MLLLYGEENPDLHASNLPSHVRGVALSARLYNPGTGSESALSAIGSVATIDLDG